jgi:hypothetical protein
MGMVAVIWMRMTTMMVTQFQILVTPVLVV